jgi:hypothetical protein
MKTVRAWLIGFGIFLYFSVATAWLPSAILTGPFNSSDRIVQDLVTVAVWGFFLLLGLWGLRMSQKRGWM